MKVFSVVGNRPQFVKARPVSVALARSGIAEIALHTGQHWDSRMSDVFYSELELEEPRYKLDLQTADPAAMEPPIRAALGRERPDWVLVYGDTNSTVAGARAAVAAGIPVAHVEAGLRSGDWTMPEERNRVEVDRLAALLLAPTEGARATLEREEVPGRVEVVGDVMYDVALEVAARVRTRRPWPDLAAGAYVLATIHREANVQPERLRRILSGLARLGEPVVLPAHPRTRNVIDRHELPVGHVRLVPPLGYLEFAALAAHARVIVTDSGGLQKEAYWYGVPCVTTRPSTEWTETVAAGANVLVDDDPDAIVAAVSAARMPAAPPRLYGDGKAGEHIAWTLLSTSTEQRHAPEARAS